jgi:hypothetical protein
MRPNEQHSRRGPGRAGFHQILILLFGSMLFGGSGDLSLSEAVEESVEEGPRRERALASARELDAMPAEIVGRLITLHEEFYSVLDDAELEEEALRSSLDAMVDHLYASDLEALELRFQLAGELTDAEWRAVWESGQAAGDWSP